MPVILFTGSYPGSKPNAVNALNWFDFSDVGMVWADTARTTPITDGTEIKGVTDQGSAANHLSEATNGPTWRTSPAVSFNNNPAADFDGTNDSLATTSTFATYGDGTRSGGFVVMAVMSHDTALTADGGGWNPHMTLVYHNDAGTSRGYYIYGSSTTVSGYGTQDTTSSATFLAKKAATINTKYIYTGAGIGDGAADPNWVGIVYAGLNDTRDASLASTTDTGGNFVRPANSKLYIGGNDPGSLYFWDGQVCEVAYWNTKIDENTRKQVEMYWGWKYDITLPY
jgi:hypothetical protein